ncbi:MAG: ATP-binding protein [Streptosporangiaceae bacterium]
MTGQEPTETGNTISGGIFHEPVLQAANIQATFQLPAAAPVARSQLPAPITGFSGRDSELADLARLLDPAGTSETVVLSAVAGLAGVGKTTLAVQAGHDAMKQGWFGGGVLFVNLHGYDMAPVEPGQALAELLRALGVPGEHIPPTVEERAGLYRSILAEIGEPLLVVADNASTEAQVLPLLPGAGPHKVLVTSRHTLAGLDARLVDLTVLDEAAAIHLLDAALRSARPSDRRISDDRPGAVRLTGLCGGLPLALQIVGALLKADPALRTTELADQLSGEKDRLEALRYDDGSGTGGRSVAVVFGLSYHRLDETDARVFRLMTVSPGPDFSTEVATVLADMPALRLRQALTRLLAAHLIEEPAGKAGRWQMHDLVRLYAQRLSEEHADVDGREQAGDRLLAYYIDMAAAAEDHLRALSRVDVPDVFTGRDEALAWLDGERASLIAAVQMAANSGRNLAALGLTLALSEYFSWRRRFDDWITAATTSLDIARRLGDRRSEGAVLGDLGIALQEVGRFEEAITAHQGAATIFRETGDRHGQGMVLTSLGLTLRNMERFEEAITTLHEAIIIFTATGDRHGQAMALDNVGIALQEVGRFEEAITAHQGAATIFRETGDRHGQGMALNNLGITLRQMGQFEAAITAHQQDLAVCREIGDRHGEAMALNNLGKALRQMRRFDEAMTVHQDAAIIFRETGDRRREGSTLDNLGNAFRQMGRWEQAISAYQDAAAIFRETGAHQDERAAVGNLEAAKAAQRT